MHYLARLAFVDVETTGLNPEVDRITEIAIIIVDGVGSVHEWSTLVNSRGGTHEGTALPGVNKEVLAAAPLFRDVAMEVTSRLAGRLFIAHNARFDHGFLKAEFQRVGVPFEPRVLCSVMLSRKLYGEARGHDLDALIQRHGLTAGVRHRALPDARVLWQFWQAICREHPKKRVGEHIKRLLAGPVLPSHLDPALIDRLPDAPGVYVLHGEDRPLHIGTASNLRREVSNYFRLDRTTPRALAISHLVTDITWRRTQGMLGARLQRAVISADLRPLTKAPGSRYPWSWQFVPHATPIVELISLSEWYGEASAFGIYDSARKARNALARVAARHGLCHALLGIQAAECDGCSCAGEGERTCKKPSGRLQHMTRALAALFPLRMQAWPYAGPIGIRERRDVHVIDDWRYLGTASDEREIRSLLTSRRRDFDRNVFCFLTKKLPRLPVRHLLPLSSFAQHRDTRRGHAGGLP